MLEFVKISDSILKRFLVAIFVCYPLFNVSIAHGSATGSDLEELANQVRDLRNRLVSISNDYQDMNVPKGAMLNIKDLKEAMAQLTSVYVSKLPTDSVPDGVTVETKLNELIDSRRLVSGMTYATEDSPNNYGQEIWFEVSPILDQRGLLAIKSSFSLPCGNDSMLLIFEPNESGWKRVLRWESGGYEEIDGALNDFQFAVSPPDSRGQWYVLAAHSPARPASCRGILKYDVLRPGENDSPPSVVISGQLPEYSCDDAPELLTGTDEFEIKLNSSVVHGKLRAVKFIRRI